MDEPLNLEEIKALEKTAQMMRLAGSDVFWSPQEKDDWLDNIDKEIDEAYVKLQRTNQNTT